MAELKLLDFQKTSVTKLSQVTSGLLGDDMGLGKTIQAIKIDEEKRRTAAALFAETYRGKALTLIVCPFGVRSVWTSHYTKWAPHLKVLSINAKDRSSFLNAVQRGTHDVYVIHWQGLRMIEELQTIRWFHVIADEVHRAKNRKSQQTVALKKLWTQQKLGCSGTPADNKPEDLWSILNWLYPKKYSSFNQFADHYVLRKWHNQGYCAAEGCENPNGSEKYHERGYTETMGVANVEELHEGMEPFYVRRLKTEVLDDLPDKYYTTVEVDLLPAQRRAYNEMRDNMLAWIGKQEDQPVAAPVVIAQLTRLQQFACAYGRLETILRKYRKCKYEWCVAPCEGHLVDVLRLEEPSSKLDAAMDIVEDNPGKQIVVFGQSKQMINMFAARLAKRKITTAVYTGDTPDKDRTRLVEEFQQGERQIFAGTIAAGGEGITLTAASTEIYFDRAWNPTANKQSEDRCWRIGQTNAVQVISLIARDTIDFARNAKIELKWSWLKELLGDEMREA